MKRALLLAVLATALVPMYHITVHAEHLDSTEVSKSAAAIGFNQTIDASRWSTLGAQAVWSDGTPSTHTIADGVKSTATITVGTSATPLISTQARVNILVSSPTTMSGDSITLNGIKFTEGTDFDLSATTATMVAALTAKINAHPDFVATFTGSTITVRYVTVGEVGNGLAATASDANTLRLSAATFTGGINQHTITINGIVLTEGTSFSAGLSSGTAISSMTAAALVTAINANATLAAQVVASTPIASGRRVDITALTSGNLGYYIASTTSGFTTTAFTPGVASDIDLTNDMFNKTSHGLTTGLKVLLSTPTGASITGLYGNTTYYAIKVNENYYKLATTSTTAAAGTAIDLTNQTGSGSNFSMYPAPLVTAAGNGFYWSFSNDAVNFSTYTTAGTSVSSVTYSGAGAQVWDFGTLNFRYIRCNFAPPTSGGIALTVRMYGKKD